MRRSLRASLALRPGCFQASSHVVGGNSPVSRWAFYTTCKAVREVRILIKVDSQSASMRDVSCSRRSSSDPVVPEDSAECETVWLALAVSDC